MFCFGNAGVVQHPVLFVEVPDELQKLPVKPLRAAFCHVGAGGIFIFPIAASHTAEAGKTVKPQLDDHIRFFHSAFKEEFGITSFGLDKLVVAGYKALGLISYLTAGEQEVRAWTIVNGTKAPQAAGKIHTDFEKGFIKAEVVDYNDLVTLGSYTTAKEKGLVRVEGKEYIVKDGDVMLFRFNV